MDKRTEDKLRELAEFLDRVLASPVGGKGSITLAAMHVKNELWKLLREPA